MHVARLRLRDYRNYARLDATFAPGFHLLIGRNAQGKTNVLEAIYLVATLRSFRGVGGLQMVRQGQKGYFVGATVCGQATQEVKIYWGPRERKLALNGSSVRSLPDYLGTLRAVVFCTEDLMLVKGPSRTRRRFLDLLLVHTHRGYLPLLQQYARALRARNALLKQSCPDPVALESFTRELVERGNQVMRHRIALIPILAPLAQQAYARIAGTGEELRLEYEPSVRADFALELGQSQYRERVFRSTVLGPHRDELAFKVDGRPAAQFCSEGQKRTLAIALKMAQAEHLTTLHGTPPVLLIDDIMGELDAARRAGLMPLLDQARQGRGQVFMTSTAENWPRELARDVQRWQVDSGAVRAADHLEPGGLMS